MSTVENDDDTSLRSDSTYMYDTIQDHLSNSLNFVLNITFKKMSQIAGQPKI
jgi:hypothetical protein